MTAGVTPPNPEHGSTDRHRDRQDPTLMTIDSIRREIAMLENLLDTRLEAAEDLTVERFARVDALMDRAEELRREQKADTAAAVAASLEAQKESTHKMEKSISEQIGSLRGNFETEVRSIRAALEDLKARLTIMESVKQGAVEQKTETRTVTAGVYAAIGIGITVLLAILTIAAFFAGGSSM